MKNVTYVQLEGENNYAILAPDQITFISNASKKELEEVMEEVYEETKDIEIDKPNKLHVSLALMPTYDCNLRCIYCYSQGGKTKETINFETAKKTIDYARKYNKEAKTLDLYLVGGGEPLLYIDKVKEIVEYADTIFKRVQIHVVTNATFSPETRDWLIKRKANVRVSYDVVGQKKQRPFYNNKFSGVVVINNIKELIAGGLEIIVQCIITDDTVTKMREIVNELINLKVKVVKLEPCLINDISRGTKQLQPSAKDYANNLIDVIEYVANNELDILIDTGYFTRPTTGNYCGMGDGNFVVTPEKMITSCVEVAKMQDPYSDIVMFGKITDEIEIDLKKQKFLKKLNYENQKGDCRTCNLRLICLGGCPMANIWENGFPLTKSNYTCMLEKIFLPKILSKISQNENIIQVIMENPVMKY